MSESSEDRKLAFRVVYSSSEDDNYPVYELNVHSPQTKGWQSARHCTYPQEIIFQLMEGACKITQVQLLSHQCKISTKIELFAGSGRDLETCRFARLGFLSLVDNAASDYKARELKSVFINTSGNYLKLVLHKCYQNQYNIYNQVGLIAVNILGAPDKSPATIMHSLSNDLPVPVITPVTIGNAALDHDTALLLREVTEKKHAAVKDEDFLVAKRYKELEDYIKQEGAQLLELETKKALAVREENYELADKLKKEVMRQRYIIIDQMVQAGVRQPDSNPHMHTPPRYSHGGPEYTNPQFHTPMQPYHSMRHDGPQGPHDSRFGYSSANYDYPSNAPHSLDNRAPPYGTGPMNSSYSSGSPGGRPVSRAIRPSTEKTFEAALMSDAQHQQKFRGKDDGRNAAPEPTGVPEVVSPFGDRAGHSKGISEEPSGQEELIDMSEVAGIEGVNTLPAPDPMDSRIEKEGSFLASYCSEYIIRCLFSKDWRLREVGILKFALDLPSLLEAHPDSRLHLFKITCTLISHFLKTDKIANIFAVATGKLLPAALLIAGLPIVTEHSVLPTAIPGDALSRAELMSSLDDIITRVIERLGENIPKLRETAIGALLELSLPVILGANIISYNLLRKQPGAKKAANQSLRAVQSRLQMFTLLVEERGLLQDSPQNIPGGSGHITSINDIIQFCVENDTFTHANGDTRRYTFDLFIAIVQATGKNLLPQIQPYLRQNQLKEYANVFDSILAQGAGEGTTNSGQYQSSYHTSGYGGSGQIGDQVGNQINNQQIAPEASENAEDELAPMEGSCQFCGGCGPEATEAELDLHYWQHCPVLMACPRCQQVIEIATYPEHLLDECDYKEEYQPCNTCGQAILSEEMEQHVVSDQCVPHPPNEDTNRCPLCLTDIEPGKEGWLVHLLDAPGCPKNPRTNGSQ